MEEDKKTMSTTRPTDKDMSRLFDAALDEPLEMPPCERPSLYFLRGQNEGERVVLPESGKYVLGRRPSCNVVFPSDDAPMVSAEHAELRIEGNRVTLRDIGSTNGTYLNGKKIESPRILADRDQVELGHPGVLAVFLAGSAGDQNNTTRNAGNG